MTAPKRICLLPDDGWSWVKGPKPPYEENAIEYVRADLADVQPAHGVWNKCTFDLSGAGYDCALKDGGARHGAYGEGQKVFWDGTTINADGLYILSKPALDKRIAAAQPAHVHPDPRDEVIARLVDALSMAQLWLDYAGAYDMQGINAALAAAKAVVK